MTRILLLDNYDSFTYNLSALVQEITGERPDVVRSDQIRPEAVAAYDKILLSPGPGLPQAAGRMMTIIDRFAAEKPILGICLGHQAIGLHFGARLKQLESVKHGVAEAVSLVKSDAIFKGVDAPFQAGRYHSWVLDPNGFPDCLEVTATSSAGEIMAFSHRQYDLKGLQFHPESVLTPLGERIIKNWLRS